MFDIPKFLNSKLGRVAYRTKANNRAKLFLYLKFFILKGFENTAKIMFSNVYF